MEKEKIKTSTKIVGVIVGVGIISTCFILMAQASYYNGQHEGWDAGYMYRDNLYKDNPGWEQWFAVNGSFIKVCNWTATASGHRFSIDYVDFNNMTGMHLIEFSLAGVNWTTLPLDRVNPPSDDTVRIQPIGQLPTTKVVGLRKQVD